MFYHFLFFFPSSFIPILLLLNRKEERLAQLVCLRVGVRSLWFGCMCWLYVVLQITQTMQFGPKAQIAIPAQGMIEFRDALTELLDQFGTDDGEKSGQLTPPAFWYSRFPMATGMLIPRRRHGNLPLSLVSLPSNLVQ